MNKKSIKSILLTTTLTLGISFSVTGDAYAATYTTVSGDSLYKISRLFNTTVGSIMDDNSLRTYNLNIGQNLYMPCKTYSVQKGDTLWLISQKFNITLSDLRKANNIYTNYIDIGQELIIPKTFTTSADAPSETDTDVNETAVVTAPVATAPVEKATYEAALEPAVETAQYSAEDLDLLARLIMAESQGQPYDAQVAVGAVVINRMQSGLFPTTVRGVIYQNINGYYQFTPVVNGWIDKPANAEAIEAAKEAFKGTDPTNGALFYYDNSTTNEYMLAKKVSFTSGAMIYAY